MNLKITGYFDQKNLKECPTVSSKLAGVSCENWRLWVVSGGPPFGKLQAGQLGIEGAAHQQFPVGALIH